MTAPRCTVAVPVYNRRELTLRAVRSALDQDVDGLEVVAVDDCSTDDVWDALQQLRDPRLRLIRNPTNLGLFGNFNRCLELARGQYIRLLCCDDRLLPGCLRTEVELLDAEPQAALVSTRGRLVRPDGTLHTIFARHLPAGFYPGSDAVRAALWVNSYYGFNPFNYPSGVLLRRSAVERAGRFDARFKVAGDVDLFLRTLRHGGLIVADHFGCEILYHEGQVSHSLAQAGHHLRELWRITLAYRDLVGRRRTGEFVRQLAGQALGWELLFRAKGDRAAASAYAAIRNEMNVAPGGAVVGLSLLTAHRLAERVSGTRRILFRRGTAAPPVG